jgi:hypothetical protein
MAAKQTAQFSLDRVTALSRVQRRHPGAQRGITGKSQVIGEVAGTLQASPEDRIRARTVARLQADLDIREAAAV